MSPLQNPKGVTAIHSTVAIQFLFLYKGILESSVMYVSAVLSKVKEFTTLMHAIAKVDFQT